MTNWIREYPNVNNSFWHIWTYGLGGFRFPISIALIVITASVFGSVMVSIISRSMKMGVFKYGRFFRDMNESFIPTLFSAITYAGIYVGYKVLVTLLLRLWLRLSPVAGLSLSIISILIACSVSAFFISLITLLIPIQAFTGVKTKRAIGLSIHKANKSTLQFMFASAVPLIGVMIIRGLIGLLQLRVLSLILSCVSYAFLFAYAITLSMIAYTETEGIVREDYPRGYIKK